MLSDMTDQARVGIPEALEPVISGGARLVGRDGFVELIGEKLEEQKAAGEAVALIPASVSLHGWGGVGKTALALEFCYSPQSQDFDTIWWVNAESELTLDAAYQAFREHLQLSPETRGDELRDLINRHVASLGSCLIVYDNVEDKAALNKFLPANYRASILATSRSSSQWAPDSALVVDVLDLEPARDWLLHAAKVTENYGDPVAKDSQDYINATWLAGKEAMDGLALALRMATTLIADTPGGLEDYQHLYKSSAANVVNKGELIPPDYPDTVYATFAVSLNKLVSEEKTAAKKLLEIASFYAPDSIPIEIFTEESLDAVPVLSALQDLASLALVMSDRENKAFSIHRLVQEVTRYYLRNDLPDQAVLKAAHDIVVLVATADPPDSKVDNLLDVETAVSDVHQLVEMSKLSHRIVEAHPCSGASNRTLAEALNQSPPPDVVVMIGHGDPDQGLALRDPDNPHETQWVPAKNLPQGFSRVKLVILANCYSSAVAEQLAQLGPTVVGATDFLEDSLGRSLVWGFLREALNNRDMETAFSTAKDSLQIVGSDAAYIALGQKGTQGVFF